MVDRFVAFCSSDGLIDDLGKHINLKLMRLLNILKSMYIHFYVSNVANSLQMGNKSSVLIVLKQKCYPYP